MLFFIFTLYLYRQYIMRKGDRDLIKQEKLEINKIYNMDCLEGMKLIPDKSIDCIICDLPYGTTAVACINTNRNYIGFELDKKYYDLATERINKSNNKD